MFVVKWQVIWNLTRLYQQPVTVLSEYKNQIIQSEHYDTNEKDIIENETGSF